LRDNLNIPLGPSPAKKLLLFSCVNDFEEDDKIIEESNNFDYVPILEISIYIKLEEKLKKTFYAEMDYSGKQIEISHIIHKLCFDC